MTGPSVERVSHTVAGSIPSVPRARIIAGARSAAIVVGIAIVAGALDPFGQQYLAGWINPLANSAGGYTFVIVLAILVARPGPVLGAALGLAGFVVMLQAYSVVSTLRGSPDERGFGDVWILISLVAGPTIGLATTWLRERRRVLAAIGAGVIAAALLGESIYGLTVVAATTSGVYWVLQILAALALLTASTVRTLRAPGPILVATGVAAVGADVAAAAFTML